MPGLGVAYFILAILSIKQPTIISNKFMYFISVSSFMFALAEIVRTIVRGIDRLVNIINKNKKYWLINYEKYIEFINLIKQYHNIFYGLFSILGVILLVIWPVVKLKNGNYTESANTVTILSFGLFFLESNLESLFDKVIKSFQENLTKGKNLKKKFEKNLEEELKKVFEEEVEKEKNVHFK